MANVKITETVLRDSHQSLIATRMTTEEMLPILGELDKSYPHFGGMVDSWTTKAKLFGRVFYLDKDKMARPAKRAVKAPAKAVKPVKTVKPAKPVVKNPPLAVVAMPPQMWQLSLASSDCQVWRCGGNCAKLKLFGTTSTAEIFKIQNKKQRDTPLRVSRCFVRLFMELVM